MRPHKWQPTRLPRPWDSLGKNTGVGCHFLLQGVKVKSESEVAQSCLTLSDPMDCSLPGSSVHGIFQARVLEWGAIAFSKAALTVSKGEKWTGRELIWRENEETGSELWMSRIWGSNSNWYTFLVTMFVCSVAQLCLTLCKPMESSTPGFPVLHYLLEFAQMHVHWVSDAIQPSRPLSSPSPPAFNFPGIRIFSSESALWIRWPKYWSFSFRISPFNEYSGIDWLDLLVVQGTLKSILQHYSSKALILRFQSSLWSNYHIHTWLLERPYLWRSFIDAYIKYGCLFVHLFTQAFNKYLFSNWARYWDESLYC